MGIISRISAIIESNINSLLDQAEDPHKMINQMIRDMQDNLREAKKSVALAIRDQENLKSRLDRVIARSADYEAKATLALKQGKEGLAREAIKRKLTEDSLKESFSNELEIQNKNMELLTSSLRVLESKISQAKHKRELLLARSRRAAAQKNISAKINGLEIKESPFEGFERMEDQIRLMEAEARADRQLAEQHDNDMDLELENLNIEDRVAEELKKLAEK